MEENKIIIYPKFKSFTNMLTIIMGFFYFGGFIYFSIIIFIALKVKESLPDFPYLIIGFGFLFLMLYLGIDFFFGPLSKKITFIGNTVIYQNWFFLHYQIEISPETKIIMGRCYPAIGAHPQGIWKISNHRGKEKIKIHSDFFDYKKVNKELEKLTKYKIVYSNQVIKF